MRKLHCPTVVPAVAGDCATGLRSVPMPSISTSTTSPGRMARVLPGRAGINDVAGKERDPAADPVHDCRTIEGQIRRGLLLHDFAVQARFEHQVAVIEAGDYGRPQRREGVGSLGAPPLQILARTVLPVALADVVAAGDAEDGPARADHDDQFALEVYVGGIGRDDDRAAGMLQRADGLVEHLGTVRGLAVAQVALVIAAHRQNLGWLAGI